MEKISESVFCDADLENSEEQTTTSFIEEKDVKPSSMLDSITSAIDELENSDKEDIIVEDLPLDTVIPVKSITFGGLTYKSKVNNAIFRWNRIGAVEYMTVSQLNEMNNYKRDFLNKPYVILMDERAIRKFRLTKIYENVAKINDLKRIFASDKETIKSTIKMAIDVNMRDILISKISQMIKVGNLVNINVIKLLKEELGYDFDELLKQVE